MIILKVVCVTRIYCMPECIIDLKITQEDLQQHLRLRGIF